MSRSRNLCGYRYGHRRHLVCARPAGHAGRHAVRQSIRELARTVLQKGGRR